MNSNSQKIFSQQGEQNKKSFFPKKTLRRKKNFITRAASIVTLSSFWVILVIITLEITFNSNLN